MDYYVRKTGSAVQTGSFESPFSTINQAAAVAQAGDRVFIGEGIYRERVDPVNGGTDDGHRIVYTAIEGEHPVISGAEIIKDWTPVGDDLYRTQIPLSSFGEYCPYTDLIFGDWFDPAGHNHHTGEIFIDDTRCREVDSIDDFGKSSDPSRKEWHCSVEGENVVLWLYLPGLSPEGHLVEATFRPLGFFPSKEHVSYITVSGITVEKVATQWAPPTAFQSGAIGPNWSKGWIIENCTVRFSKCSGISLGKRKESLDNKWTKYKSKGGAQTQTETVFTNLKDGWNKENIGGHIVRGNTITDCGQAGIVGCMGGAFSLIENNHIGRINTNYGFGGWEIAGIKFHAAIDTIIRRNVIYDSFRGMWIDWEAQGTRVTKNVFFQNRKYDLCIEVCHGPAMIDHNLFLSGTAIFNVSQGTAFVHNLFVGNLRLGRELKRFTMYHFKHDTAVKGSMIILGGDDRLMNNLYLGKPEGSAGNAVYNDYSSFETWQNVVPHGFQLGDDNVPSLPVYLGGNAFNENATPAEREKDAQIIRNSSVNLDVEDDCYVLNVDISDELFTVQKDRITTEKLGRAFEPEDLYEDPNGNPIRFDTDFCDNEWGEKVFSGPFSKPVKRIVISKVF